MNGTSKASKVAGRGREAVTHELDGLAVTTAGALMDIAGIGSSSPDGDGAPVPRAAQPATSPPR